MELNFTVETKDALLDRVKRHNKMYRWVRQKSQMRSMMQK